jgi:phage terminase large subunit GpA-like protein
LRIPRKTDVQQSANFCDFPREFQEDFFKQLTAEEMVQNADCTVTFTKSSSVANEALDLFVANFALRDHYLNELVLSLRADAKNRRVPMEHIQTINSRTALEWLSQSTK